MLKICKKKEQYIPGLRKVKLLDIKIPWCFKAKKSLPTASKMRSKYAAYRSNPKGYDKGKKTRIVVNQDLVLQDGYITYLILKMFDKRKVAVKIV